MTATGIVETGIDLRTGLSNIKLCYESQVETRKVPEKHAAC